MSCPSSLCPGYKQVEAFGPDEDYDSDEEVCYVTLDLGSIEPTLVPSSSAYRLIGLDTPTPFLQLSGTVLKGHHDSLLGTELLFTDDKDETDRNKRSIVHIANTEQRICFKEVRLQPKQKEPKRLAAGFSADQEMAPPLTIASTPASEEAMDKIDRLTGKTAPITRAGRGKGEGTKDKGKGKGKAKATEDADAEEDIEGRDEAGYSAAGEEAPRPSMRPLMRAKPKPRAKPKKGKERKKAMEGEEEPPVDGAGGRDGDINTMDVGTD